VFTDGEARSANVPTLAQSLRQAEGVRLLFLRFWSDAERVRVNGRLEPQYRPDTRSGPALVRLARALGAQVFEEHERDRAADALRRAVGSGPLARRASERESLALAPWAVVLALLPVGFLVWSRNRA
jgi:hypothetical protein